MSTSSRKPVAKRAASAKPKKPASAKQSKTSSKTSGAKATPQKSWAARKATLNAMPDSIDLRDWVYQPNLMQVPPTLVNCHRVPEILDQGREGACCGFALAAVVNFLRHAQGDTRRVSPRMLYEMARRYDEWPGEWYEGSSARGAMKGWMRHGVAERPLWGDTQKGTAAMTPAVVKNAMLCPGGAYCRVNHRQVRDMHCALVETGILYVTLMVHDGWAAPGPIVRPVKCVVNGKSKTLKLPVITRAGRADSGHAVAIVGYTEHGFIIQNSWGADWGMQGFALLPYEDYMLHATDVWVAQLGVPVSVDVWIEEEKNNAKVSEGNFRALPALTLDTLRPYVVNVGNNGELSANGDFWTTPEDLERLLTEDIPRVTKHWKKRRVMLFLHGGLNSEKDCGKRVAALRAPCEANEIYPLHIMWETGFMESLRSYFADWFSHADQLAGRSLLGNAGDIRDLLIERSLALPLRGIWGEMKENARLASEHRARLGAMQLLAEYIRKAGVAGGRGWELHVVGHSAGSIFFAWMLQHIVQLQLPLKSVQLLAPAMDVALFKSRVMTEIAAKNCPLPILYLLSDPAELDDTVGSRLVYGKSLLYLVSRACETKRDTPILGMHACIQADAELAAAYRGAKNADLPHLILTGARVEPPGRETASSHSRSHGGFDNDAPTMNSVLYRILGHVPPRPFTPRDLNYD